MREQFLMMLIHEHNPLKMENSVHAESKTETFQSASRKTPRARFLAGYQSEHLS